MAACPRYLNSGSGFMGMRVDVQAALRINPSPLASHRVFPAHAGTPGIVGIRHRRNFLTGISIVHS